MNHLFGHVLKLLLDFKRLVEYIFKLVRDEERVFQNLLKFAPHCFRGHVYALGHLFYPEHEIHRESS